MNEPAWDFEQAPHDPTDETGVNLRAYLDRMPDEKMQQYSSAWSDDEVVALEFVHFSGYGGSVNLAIGGI